MDSTKAVEIRSPLSQRGIVGDVGGQIRSRLDQPLQLGIAAVQGGDIRGELLGPGQRFPGVAVPEPPLDPLQAALQRSSLDWVVVRQAFGYSFTSP